MRTRGKLLLYKKIFEQGILRNEISKILSHLSKMNSNTIKWNGNVLNGTCAREITSALIITNEKKISNSFRRGRFILAGRFLGRGWYSSLRFLSEASLPIVWRKKSL